MPKMTMRLSGIYWLVLLSTCSCSHRMAEADFAAFKEKYQAKIHAKSAPAPNGRCQRWTGTSQAGYGVIYCQWKNKWKKFYVHRLSLVFNRGWTLEDVEEAGMDVSHLCHDGLCVNPEHLSYEPHQVNRIRSACVAVRVCQGHGTFPRCMFDA